MNTEKSLWGNLPLADVTRTPIIILREQATILTELTNGLLEGIVTNRVMEGINKLGGYDAQEPKKFNATLSIIAPALDGYTFRLLQVNYNLDLYPVEVLKLESNYFLSEDVTVCDNEAEFLEALSGVLGSEPVRTAVGKLLAQSKSAMPV